MQQTLLYGDSQTGNRPGCWGRTDVYDSENRECRGCGFQNSCRNQVIKLTPQQQVIPQAPMNAPTYYPYQTAPYQAPVPAPMPMQAPVPAPMQIARYQPSVTPAPIAPPTYVAPAPVRVPAPIPTQQPQQMQNVPPQQDWYGRMQDPLFFHILSPPPFRPQMPGEVFGERLLKNLALDVAAMACGHLMLGLRQMILPPGPPSEL